jgi:thioredoxin-related protein
MRRLLAAAALTLSLLAGSAAGTTSGDPPVVRWQGWDAGLKDAAKVQRPVLIDVYTGWCGWCKRMDRDVYARADVRDYLAKRFVTVKLDAEASDAGVYDGKTYTSATLAGKFRVTGYPTTIFLRSNGDHLVNVPGYVPADRFLLLLRYIGEGAMDRNVSFDDFVKSETAH